MKNVSSIGMLTPQGVLATTAGWNGIPMHDGQILINCWNTPKAVAVLIGLGDLVYLGPNVAETVAHTRDFDRDWALTMPKKFISVKQWQRQEHYYGVGCYYLFDPNNAEWCAYDECGHILKELSEYKIDG